MNPYMHFVLIISICLIATWYRAGVFRGVIVCRTNQLISLVKKQAIILRIITWKRKFGWKQNNFSIDITFLKETMTTSWQGNVFRLNALPKYMMTSSNGNIFRVTGHLSGPGEFSTQRPVTRSFDVYFDLRPNKWMSKQSWGWWFETLSCSLWRHRNAGESTLHFTHKRIA